MQPAAGIRLTEYQEHDCQPGHHGQRQVSTLWASITMSVPSASKPRQRRGIADVSLTSNRPALQLLACTQEGQAHVLGLQAEDDLASWHSAQQWQLPASPTCAVCQPVVLHSASCC